MNITCYLAPNKSRFTMELDAEAITSFKQVLNRALNCWPDAPPEWKDLADRLEFGKPLQNYYPPEKKD